MITLSQANALAPYCAAVYTALDNLVNQLKPLESEVTQAQINQTASDIGTAYSGIDQVVQDILSVSPSGNNVVKRGQNGTTYP